VPWVQVAGIAWVAPQVVAYRTARMLTGGWPPSARDRREYRLMVREKVAAVAEVAAVVTSSRRHTAGAVLEPVHRRVMANRKRLARG
jgi:hypothetical protein